MRLFPIMHIVGIRKSLGKKYLRVDVSLQKHMDRFAAALSSLEDGGA